MSLINFDANSVIDGLSDFEKNQFPFAIAVALTEAAKIGKRDLTAQLTQNLDRPTPYTMKAVFVKSASKKDFPESASTVGIKDGQSKYLQAEFSGGTRNLKPFEVKFGGEKKFAKLPANFKKDAYGNIKKSQLLAILAAAKTKGSGVFVSRSGDGIYQRFGDGLKPILYLDSDSPNYTEKLSLKQTQDVIEQALPDLLDLAITKAIQTARL
jgi:hypothetical protein